MCAKFTRCAAREVVARVGGCAGAITAARLVGHDRPCEGCGAAAVVDPAAAEGGTVPADGRVGYGHVAAVVEDPAAEGGIVPADGRVGDGHGALVEYPAAVAAGIAACHSQVLERHRKAGTVGECSAGVAKRVTAI